MFYLIILILFISSVNGANQLHIGGIFPIAGKGGWQGGQACMPAAKLALQDVNENPDLLPGFNLTLHSNDSEASDRQNPSSITIDNRKQICYFTV